jgi:hypothetical protein
MLLLLLLTILVSIRSINFGSQRLENHTVEGNVAWPDGTPAVGAIVELLNPDDIVIESVETDEAGHFTLTGFSNIDYKIKAYKDLDQEVADSDNSTDPERTVR